MGPRRVFLFEVVMCISLCLVEITRVCLLKDSVESEKFLEGREDSIAGTVFLRKQKGGGLNVKGVTINRSIGTWQKEGLTFEYRWK